MRTPPRPRAEGTVTPELDPMAWNDLIETVLDRVVRPPADR